MPRPTNSPSHKAHCTPAQKEAVKQAAYNTGVLQGEFQRMALKVACAIVGIEYPDDLPKRGKYLRKTTSDKESE